MAEGCLSVENQLGVENTSKGLKTLDDEIQQKSNNMSTLVQQG
nr:hypothetical protein [Clostridium butyricum]